ncbi:MAG: hypothetical protein H7X80_06010 [bacterium]|nr:hypothetical protein [Candidatus Kapabacteria bacterium]
MNVQRTIAFVLGGVAAGGAIAYGVSRFARPGNGRSESSAKSRGGILVRVTENGKKYHRDTCPLLHGETRVINVAEALQNYEPCKACHPPGNIDPTDTFDSNDASDSSDVNHSTAARTLRLSHETEH